MDTYAEYIIKKKKRAADYALIVLAVFAGAVLSLAALLVNAMILGLGWIAIAFVWYGVYVLINSRNLEYEYIVTNGELDVDKIIAKNGRKRIITVDFREVELCARVNDGEFRAQYENTANIAKVLDLTGDAKSDNVYFADFHSDGERKRILFEPNEKIFNGLKQVNPRNVHA